MDIFHFSAYNEAIIESIFAQHNYAKKYTFFGDLATAEWYGTKSVKSTFKDICNSWKGSVEAFTEFVMCLNHRCWMYYDFAEQGALAEIEAQNPALADTFRQMPMMELSMLYSDLYYKARDIALGTYKGKDLEYFLNTTD